MHADRRLLLIIGIFIALSLLMSWKSLTTPGNFIYRDHWTSFDAGLFKEFLFHLFKNYGEPNLDLLKRIPELWIHLIVDYEAYDKFSFALLAFGAFLSSFFVSKKILDEGDLPENQRYAIAFLAAFFYVVNPFNTQIFLRYYASLNYAIFPVFFYALFLGFSKPDRRMVVISGILSALMFMMVVHAVLHIAVCLFVVFLICFRKPAHLAGIIKNGALFSAAFLSSSAFALLPYLFLSFTTGVHEGPSELTTSMLDRFSAVMNLPNAMLLDYNVFWWPYVDYDYPAGTAFFLISFFFAGTVLVHSFFDRNKWALASITALALLYFFSKGNSPPFGFLYETFNFMLPGVGWLFRVPVKFLYPIPFFFSILLMRAFVGAYNAWKPSLLPLGVLAMVFLAVFSWPFFTGDMKGVITKNKFQYKPEVKALNSFLGEGGYTSAVVSGTGGASMLADSWTAGNNLNAEILKPGPLLMRELDAYYMMDDWMGLDTFSGLGLTHLISIGGPVESTNWPRAPAFTVANYSVYRLKDDYGVISAANSSSLCYCHFDTARSIMRQPPAGASPGLLIFPYESFDFPDSYSESSDYVILDSSPLVFPAVDSKSASQFYYSALGSNPERGWAHSRPFNDTDPFYWDELHAWNWEYEFGQGLAFTEAAPKSAKSARTLTPIPTGSIKLSAADDFSTIDGMNVTKLPYRLPVSSLISADLPLEAGNSYHLAIGILSSSSAKTTIDVLMFDQYGSLSSRRRLMNASGNLSANASESFSVPYDTVRGMLAITSILTKEGSTLSITSLNLSSVDRPLSGKNISARINVVEDGDYDIFIHLLRSRKGGKLNFYLDGIPAGGELTSSESNRLHWVSIYSGPISKGPHSVTAESVGGFNALNLAYLVKTGAPEPDLSNKTFIYRLTGKNDFSGESVSIFENRTSSTFYALSSSRPVSSVFYVYRGGEYSFSSSVIGAGAALVDGVELLGDSVYLSKGQHEIEIVPESGGTLLLDQVTFMSQPIPPAHPATIISQTRLDSSAYELSVDSPGPFWLVFGRGNDPNWIAWVNGRPYHPVSAYGAVNAYFINESGLNEVRIEYEGQKYVYLGAALGLLGLLTAGFFAWRHPE